MSLYVIGDVQGCYEPLRRLLDRIGFDPAQDRLWFTGDLVNRGPQSLAVLRFVRDLGDSAVSVLGNHDLHLLALGEGQAKLQRGDTLQEILAAPDREDLLHWLRHRPLLHCDEQLPYAMIHAGLPPQWSMAQAAACAGELEAVLRSAHYPDYFRHMYGDEPDRWDDSLSGWARLRFITNCFTRLRYCDSAGRLELAAKGAPGSQPAGYLPWFKIPAAAWRGEVTWFFGHWSTLGYHRGDGVVALDTGCLWGGSLTAYAIDAQEALAVSCVQPKH